MKPVVITCNSTREIKLSEVAPNAHSIELIVGACAHVTCIDDREFTQDSLEFSLRCTVKKNAQLVYCDQRRFSTVAAISSTTTFVAHKDSVIRFEQWQHGGKKIKIVVDALLQGPQSEIDMRFGAQLTGDQKQEIKTMQLHQAAFTKSNCVMKVIAKDSARSVYDGMIEIEKIAQKSEAFQTHKAMLMSDAAYAYAHPSLQVQADDVQCGHGSAIGQIDDEQREYLYARGMNEEKVKAMLLHAFLDDLYSIGQMKQTLLTIS